MTTSRTIAFAVLFAIAALLLFVTAAVAQEPDDKLFDAIAEVESHRNPRKVNASEDAVGIVQIRRGVVDDCNHIIGHDRFTYHDRYDAKKSREMFGIYLSFYRKEILAPKGLDTYENLARTWNGGPSGYKNARTEIYWQKVRKVMEPK